MQQLPRDRIYVTKFNDPLFRDCISEYLTNQGLPLISFGNYHDLIDKLATNPNHLGAVVCELNANIGEIIPGINVDRPEEIFAYIMEKINVPVIATYRSQKKRGILERKLLALGTSSVLTHPFSDEDLHQALLKVVGREKHKIPVEKIEDDRKFYEKIVREGFGF